MIEHGAFPDGVHSWLTSKGGAVTTIVAWAILVGTVHNIIQTRRRLGFGVTDLNGIGAGCGQGMGAAARKASVSAQSRAVEGRQP